MAEFNQPPTYSQVESQVEREDAATHDVINQEQRPPTYSQVEREDTTTVAANQERRSTEDNENRTHNGRSESRRSQNNSNNNINHPDSVRDERRQNTGNHHIGTANTSNSFSGFIDILDRNEKLPCGCAKVTLYKVGLLFYYLANIIYCIVYAAIQREKLKENLSFYLVYVFISLAGLVLQIPVMIFHVKKHCTLSNNTEEELTLLDGTKEGTHINQVQGENNAIAHIRDYPFKAKRVLLDYVILSLGEFLICPILICTLYAFINERAWRLDNWISVCNLLFFLYSVVMDAIYMKIYLGYFVTRVSLASYKKYDELIPPTEMEWKRYVTPVYLTIPLAILTAVTHWLMIGIVGVSIYIDNFTPDKDDTNSSMPNTGDYRVAPFTWYILTCTIYLPIASWVTYIILNKLWFTEIFSAINQLMTMGADSMPARQPWNKKLFASFKDPLAYIAVVFLMVPFIAFIAGAYLLDYVSSDYEVSSNARDAIQRLGLCFIIFFVLSNLQATVIFLIEIMVILCGLPVLCAVFCYKICSKDRELL